MSESTKPQHRWYQFSLRTLLLGISIAGPLLGWIGSAILEPEMVPLFGPITAGTETALEAPSDEEVIRALAKAAHTKDRCSMPEIPLPGNLRIRKTRISEHVDPPKVYPMIGPAQHHHTHYRCTIKGDGLPEVVYIDHNHLHMVETPKDFVSSEVKRERRGDPTGSNSQEAKSSPK